MRDRCHRETCPKFPRYGGRGIRVCERWRESFVDFLADVGTRPTPRHSIDRRDNNGHYSCGKCRECAANGWPANAHWADKVEQAVNRRTTRWLTHDGRTMCMEEWAAEIGCAPSRILRRLQRGWPVARALTAPPSKRGGDKRRRAA